MADEITQYQPTEPIIQHFELEPRLMISCYICDIDGNDIDRKDYIDQGFSLKIVTEEVQQEVTKTGRRYDDKFYWEDKIEDLHLKYPDSNGDGGIGPEDYLETRDDVNAAMDELCGFPTYKYTDGDSSGDIIITDRVLSGLNEDDQVNVVRFERYTKRGAAETDPVTGDPVLDDEGNPKYANDTSSGVHTYIKVIDRLVTDYDYKEDPNIEIGIPENQRHETVSETYTVKIPVKTYRVTKEEGLEYGINLLLKDPFLTRFKNLEKLIIDKPIKVEMKYFIGKNYSLSLDMYSNILRRFKKIKIINPLIYITMPSGDLKLDSLEIIGCTIYINNNNLTITDKLLIEGCTLENSTDSTKSLYIKCGKDTNFNSNTIVSSIKCNFESSELNVGEFNSSDIIFDIKNPVESFTGSIISINDFDTVKIMDWVKSDECKGARISLLSITRCLTVKILGIDFGLNHVTNFNDIMITGGVDILFDNIMCNTKNSTGNLILLTKLDEGSKVTFDSCNIQRDKLCNIVDSKIANVVFSDNDISVNRLLNLMNKSGISKINFSKGDISFNDMNIDLLTGAMDGVTLKCKLTNLFIDEKFSIKNCVISGDNINFLFYNEKSNLSISDTQFKVKSELRFGIKYQLGDNFDSISNKIDFKTVKFNSNKLVIENIKTVAINNSDILSNSSTFNNIFTLRKYRVNLLSRSCIFIDYSNIHEILKSIITFKESKVKIEFNNCEYNNIEFISDKPLGPQSIIVNSSKYNFKFEGDESIINVISNDCISSGIFNRDNNIKLVISSVSKDFQYFKKIDSNMVDGKLGRGIYDYIYYGLLEKK